METVLGAIERDGFAVIEDALTADDVERLTRAVDRVWRERCHPDEPLHQLSILALDDAFLELVDQPAVLPLVVTLLGGNVYVYHCHLDVHPPTARVEPAWRWHQDGGRQNLDLPPPRPRLSVKAAYFLTDVETPDHGGLWVLRGSHVRDRLERPRNGATRPPGAEPLLAPAGSAVVFDRRLWHARGDNRSSVTRKALFYGYTYRWIRLRDDVFLDSERIRTLDSVRRQLVGYGMSAFGYWFPSEEEAPLAAVR